MADQKLKDDQAAPVQICPCGGIRYRASLSVTARMKNSVCPIDGRDF
jgi:hypothetical protein